MSWCLEKGRLKEKLAKVCTICVPEYVNIKQDIFDVEVLSVRTLNCNKEEGNFVFFSCACTSLMASFSGGDPQTFFS